MGLYLVTDTYTVTRTVEICANSEQEAIKKSYYCDISEYDVEEGDFETTAEEIDEDE